MITGFFSRRYPSSANPSAFWLLGGFAPDQAALNRFFSLHYSAALRDRGGHHPPHLGAAHSGFEQSDRRRSEGRAGHGAVPPLLHREGRRRARRVPAAVRRCCCSWRRTISAIRTTISRPTRSRRRAHIVPEWYFWPFYAILRAFTSDFIIPAKLWGRAGDVRLDPAAVLPAVAR